MLNRLFIILGLLAIGTFAIAAPIYRVERSLLPETDSTYYLGSTTPSTNAWLSVITDQLCLTGDTCRTTWPTGSGSAFPFTPTTNFNQAANATTTQIWFQGSPISLSASTTAQFNNLISLSATTTNATTTSLGVTNLSAASCDVKSTTDGAIYCGTDASGGGGSGNVATSSAETAGQIPYWTSTAATPATLGKVATSSIASGTNITVTNGSSAYVIGSQPTVNLSGIVPFTLGGTGTGGFTTNQLTYSNGSSLVSASTTAVNNSGGWLGIGTTTPQWQLQIASSTGPQFTLTDKAAVNHWSFRNAGGILYIATSSPTTFATSSVSALVVNANGNLTLHSISPSFLTIGGDTFDELVGTGLQITAGDLQTTLGTSIDLASAEVTGTLPIANGGTNATSFTPTNSLVYYNGTSLVSTSTNPLYVNALVATSTTVKSSFANLVGVGVTPTYRLDVSDATADGRAINISQTSTSGTAYGLVSIISGAATGNIGGYFSSAGASINYGVYIANPGAGDNNWSIYSIAAAKSYFAGAVGIATTSPWRTLSVVGTMSLAGNTQATGGTNNDLCISTLNDVVEETTGTCVVSSRRFKHDINLLNVSGLDIVSTLKPSTFVRDGEDIVRWGFIAEEAAESDPHLAANGLDGLPRGLDDHAFLAVITDSIQELWVKIKSIIVVVSNHESRIEKLERENVEQGVKIKMLEERLNNLENK